LKMNEQTVTGASSAKGQSAGEQQTPGAGLQQAAGYTRIKKNIAIMSGKGGVGKSAVTMLLATSLRRRGLEVGILDADITGPSIPRGLGVNGPILIGEAGVIPATSSTGIKIMSMNLILPEEDDAVIWRGPLISRAVKQFYEECDWGELDYLLVDLPPGTADVPLTVMQSIRLDGIVLVTSPQELAGMIVGKARKMAAALEAPVLGLIENMSFIRCPHCAETIEPFGESHSGQAARDMGIPLLGRLPLDADVSRLADAGELEQYTSADVDALAEILLASTVRLNTAEPGEAPGDETARVAIVMEGDQVSQHFGQCERVMIATIENGQVKSREVVDAPEHDCSALPRLFNERNVDCVIAGGLGGGALAHLQEAGVKVVAGADGPVDEVLARFLAGSLEPGEAVCGGGMGACAHDPCE